MEKRYLVDVSWVVEKTYTVPAESMDEAVGIMKGMVERGEVCVWTDGFEVVDGTDKVAPVRADTSETTI